MKHTIRDVILLVGVAILVTTIQTAVAEDAPSMWMVQTPDGGLELMVNTSESSRGANAYIYFDPVCVNLTNMDFTGSPWQPMDGPGWSHQGDYISMALTNFSGIYPGEYRVAQIGVECIGDECTSAINITRAEPVGVVTYNMTYTCSEPTIDDAEISIGDCTGSTTIPIVITDAMNVGAVDVTLHYDPTVVTVSGVIHGDMDCTFTNLENTGDGWIRVGAIQGENDGLSGQFTLLNVDLSPISSNSQCDLELTVTTFKDATPECTAMTYTISNGVSRSSKNGDVNGDDVVDIADAAYIAKHVLGLAGYGTIDESAADVNGDGMIDMSDSMYLTKHVIGITGFDELR